MPKDLYSLLLIFQQGILYRNHHTSCQEASCGPIHNQDDWSLLHITGDQSLATVTFATINTLGLTLIEGSPALRAFVPQFQFTFINALSYPHGSIHWAY